MKLPSKSSKCSETSDRTYHLGRGTAFSGLLSQLGHGSKTSLFNVLFELLSEGFKITVNTSKEAIHPLEIFDSASAGGKEGRSRTSTFVVVQVK